MLGEFTMPLNAGCQRKSHSLFFLISKLQGGGSHPFSLSPISLSLSLSSLPFNTLFLSQSSFNIHGVLMPPAAGCWLLAARTTHFPGYLSLSFTVSPAFWSSVLVLSLSLCFSLMLSKSGCISSPSFSAAYILFPTSSFQHLSLVMFSLPQCIPVHISEFLGSCILIYFTGSVSVTHPHPLIGGMFLFTEKHTKCSSYCPKKT